MASPDTEGAPMPLHNVQQYLPKSRKRTKAGRYSHEITYEELSQHFHLPTEKACQKLGVGLTILKRICRRFGLPRWPYKKPSKLVYGPTPSTYSGPGQPASQNAGATYDRHHLSDTPAANYLRAQGYGQPSPFTNVPYPTGWQMPQAWPQEVLQHQQQMQQSVHVQQLQQAHQIKVQPQQWEGCSRPIPRRLVSSENKSVPIETLRAIGLSQDAMPSYEAQTDRLDLLISAIDQSESLGGGDGDYDATDGELNEPNSPASVNTLQGSPTQSMGAPSLVPRDGGVAGAGARPTSHTSEMNEGVLAAAAAALIGNRSAIASVPTVTAVPSAPVVLKATPASPVASAPSAPTTTTLLTEALSQLTNNVTGRSVTTGNSAHAVQSLVEVLAAHPEMAQQFRKLLNQTKEPSAFTEQFHLYQAPQQQLHQQPPPPPPPQQQQQQPQVQVHLQQQQPSYIQERSVPPPSNEQDLLMHLLQRQQQQQQQQMAAVDGTVTSPAAAALRRAQLSAKFQALQTKLATRLVALQKLQNHMELQNALAASGQQHQQHTGAPVARPPAVPAPPTTAAPTGTSYEQGFSADISGLNAANAAASAAGALQNTAVGQNERREALFRLLAAKLQNQQHLHQQQQQAVP